MSDEDSRYIPDIQKKDTRPWWKKARDNIFDGCLSIDLAILLMVGAPLWWTFG